ncbi:MAG: glycoside hydrolase family 130 protein [Saprospiraceae bacterium]
MVKRFFENPILTTRDIVPSQPGFVVECVMNPSAFLFEGKTCLLLRVAERPLQRPGFISVPILDDRGAYIIMEFDEKDPKVDLSDVRLIQYEGKTYLTTISHFRIVFSEDGIHFYEPDNRRTKIFGEGTFETYGIEDCRTIFLDGVYNLTYTQVSSHGVGVGLIQTTDWKSFSRKGMIFPPHNKDCALFEEKIDGKYYCLHRPSGLDVGGNYIWMSTSDNLTHWGDHQCILHTRKGMWDSQRVGAGAAPIKTSEGWLAIYHGADENSRYCLGAVLLDLKDPSKVLMRSKSPLFEPMEDYEKNGFFNHVVFTNGHIVDGDEVVMYYGASDQVICGAKISIKQILANLRKENSHY